MSTPTHDPRQPGAGVSNGELLGLGLFLALAVTIPLLLGWQLGGLAGVPTAGIVAGLLIGIVAAGLILYVKLRRYW
ncbi:MAG: hypothetical protein ABI352_05995 [Candidatus Dormibacter sp.]